jgi:vancomycin permeability regulator SanA
MSFKTVVSFTILTWVLLIASFISTRIEIFSGTDYILSQPADKVLTGVLFFLFLFLLIFFLLHLWTSMLSKKNKSFIRTLYSTVLIFILFFILILIYIDNIGYASGKWVINKNQQNVAIVLGAAVWTGNIPSPTLSSRVDRAIELLEKDFAGKIVLTGGKAPGELSEAEVGYEYAKINGVDTSKVFIETYTSSTTDQMKWIKNNLSLNKDSVNEIIVVSDRYHLPRVIEISKFFNLDIKVAESFHKLDFKDNIYNKIREGIALFNFWSFAL